MLSHGERTRLVIENVRRPGAGARGRGAVAMYGDAIPGAEAPESGLREGRGGGEGLSVIGRRGRVDRARGEVGLSATCSGAAIGPTSARGNAAGAGPRHWPRQVQSFGARSFCVGEECEPWWSCMPAWTDGPRVASAWGQVCRTTGAAITRPNQIVSAPARNRDQPLVATHGDECTRNPVRGLPRRGAGR